MIISSLVHVNESLSSDNRVSLVVQAKSAVCSERNSRNIGLQTVWDKKKDWIAKQSANAKRAQQLQAKPFPFNFGSSYLSSQSNAELKRFHCWLL